MSAAEEGAVKTEQPSWWFDRWKSPFAAVFAVATMACGVVTLVSFSTTCWVAGFLQLLCGLVVLVIEAPTFVPCFKFASVISTCLDRQPKLLRAGLYLLMAIGPCFLNCWGTFFILGFLFNLAIVLVYMMAFVGPKGTAVGTAVHA